jgi:hypothetical protein
MKPQATIEQLLHCLRLTKAGVEAPRPPSASSLLARARPWWELMPEQLDAWIERLLNIQLVYGHALEECSHSSTAPVAALIVGTDTQKEAWARLLYINLQSDRLRLRFQLDGECDPMAPEIEVAFVSPATRSSLLYGLAVRSHESEYRLDTALPAELAAEWKQYKVTDQLPFRFILRPVAIERSAN